MKLENESIAIMDSLVTSMLESSEQGIVGFEKESMRVRSGKISQSRHPKRLGSSLYNKYITTDFSEAQLELITSPTDNKESSLLQLKDIHHFVSNNIGDEIIWPLSIPPAFNSEDEIPIAEYGESNLGIFKRIYRNGLSYRYGKSMQAISGLHYNYSFPDSFWAILSDINQISQTDQKEFRSALYFRVLRNLLRVN